MSDILLGPLKGHTCFTPRGPLPTKNSNLETTITGRVNTTHEILSILIPTRTRPPTVLFFRCVRVGGLDHQKVEEEGFCLRQRCELYTTIPIFDLTKKVRNFYQNRKRLRQHYFRTGRSDIRGDRLGVFTERLGLLTQSFRRGDGVWCKFLGFRTDPRNRTP